MFPEICKIEVCYLGMKCPWNVMWSPRLGPQEVAMLRINWIMNVLANQWLIGGLINQWVLVEVGYEKGWPSFEGNLFPDPLLLVLSASCVPWTKLLPSVLSSVMMILSCCRL
jgi:hypothetical protein